MKCLIIKDGLSIGGTTTSFLNLLNSISCSKSEKYQFDIWINKLAEEDADRIPPDVNLIESADLTESFAIEKTRFKRIAKTICEGRFFDVLIARLFSHNKKILIPVTQKQVNKHVRMNSNIDLSMYDVVITWEELFPCYLLSEKISAKCKIAWIHPDYVQCGFNPKLDYHFFSKLNAIMAVSESNCDSLKKTFPELKDKFHAMRNRVDCKGINKLADENSEYINANVNGDCFSCVTVARIQNVSKAVDRAIKIASRLKAAGKKLEWYFVGGGEDLNRMQSMAKKYRVDDIIVFVGEKKNPYPYIKNADLFILQSYYEGCPMVVDESLILGTPVLVSNYAAAKEQVSELYGIVVDNDEDSIYNALCYAIDNPEEIKKLRSNLVDLDAESYMAPSYFYEFLGELE